MNLGGVAGWLFSIATGPILTTRLLKMSGGTIVAVTLFHGVFDILMASPVKGALPSIMGAINTMWGLAIPFVYDRANLASLRRVQVSCVTQD